MSTVLISGGQGFLGQAVCRKLAGDGHRVLSLDLREPQGNDGPCEGINIVQGDLKDLSLLNELVVRHRVDGIIHTAWSWDSTALSSTDSNYRAFKNLIQLTLRHSLRRFIFVGSAAVYGETPGVLTEGTPFTCEDPERIYPAQKILLTVLTLKLANDFPGRFACLIPGGPIYGPGMKGKYENRWPLYELIAAAARGQDIAWPRGGDQKAEYIHVQDVARGIALAYAAPALTHGLYHISYGRRWSTSEILEVVKSLVPTANLQVGPGSAEPGHAPAGQDRGYLSYERARQEFGYSPQVGLREGLEGVYRWLIQQATSG